MTTAASGPRANGGASALAAWGRLVHRRRWLVLALSALMLGASVAGLLAGGNLKNTNPEGTESSRAFELIDEELPSSSAASFTLVFSSDALAVDEPAFRAALEEAVAPLAADPRVKTLVTPYDAPPPVAPRLRSTDGHHAAVQVTARDDFDTARTYYPELREKVRSDVLDVRATRNLAVNNDFDRILEEDLKRAELVSLPVTLVLLVLVFGAVVAALLPLGVGVLAVVGGVAGVLALSRVMDVSTYAVNITTLIGLGVAIDYSLFVVSRYREELARGLPSEAALARTMETAGRAILFSGVTVAVGLSGLLFFHGSFLASMGVAGALVVGLAVLYGLTFLPALLAVLRHRVDKGSVPFARPRPNGRGFWRAVARGVMRRPLVALVPTMAVLLAAGAPFLDVRLASGDIHALPEWSESREGYDLLVDEFPATDQTRVLAVVAFPGGDPLAPERVSALHDLSRDLGALPDVLRVESVVDLDPNMTKADYQALYSAPRASWPEPVREAAAGSVGERIVVLSVLTGSAPTSDEAREIVRVIREDHSAAGDGEVLVTGQTAYDVDAIRFILDRAPEAVAFVVLVTYALILVQVGSLLIPLKAVAMNFLSIAASFGAMVFVFQQGHFADVLRFTPQPIDPALPVILFCVVFGLSMDYEVLLLSRMHEEYQRTGDNARAVAEGLARSGRLITGAAAIMVVVFGAFALSDVVIIKAIGFGLATAVLLDATLVRALVVPATMRLMGDLNWWAPRFLARFARHEH